MASFHTLTHSSFSFIVNLPLNKSLKPVHGMYFYTPSVSHIRETLKTPSTTYQISLFSKKVCISSTCLTPHFQARKLDSVSSSLSSPSLCNFSAFQSSLNTLFKGFITFEADIHTLPEIFLSKELKEKIPLFKNSLSFQKWSYFLYALSCDQKAQSFLFEKLKENNLYTNFDLSKVETLLKETFKLFPPIRDLSLSLKENFVDSLFAPDPVLFLFCLTRDSEEIEQTLAFLLLFLLESTSFNSHENSLNAQPEHLVSFTKKPYSLQHLIDSRTKKLL